MRRLLAISACVTGMLLLTASVAGAAVLANPATRQLMERSPILRPTLYAAGGEIPWAVLSTKGPYAIAAIDARPGYRTTFQPTIGLLRRRDNRWFFVADLIHDECSRLPRAVRLDFRLYFAGKGRRLDRSLGGARPEPPGCAGAIAGTR